ncbi:AsmA family protein [Variovorax sp. VNK109]|uniref:AsmA family protein n=1 Tax=Variovorax sp. VNK109 TaxID=3400919 RepID=UPI003C0F5EB6
MRRLGRAWRIAAASFLSLLVLLTLLVVFFPWDVLREPVNRYVSGKTGRDFAITRHLDVKLGRETTITLDGVRFANPAWARDAQLVEADKIELDIAFWPLVRGRIEMPRLHLYNPRVSLQQEADGRRSWAMGEDTSDESNLPKIGTVRVDGGLVRYLAPAYGADIDLQFNLADAQQALPLQYSAKGKWKNQAFTAEGRAGDVMRLHEIGENLRFPLKIEAKAGRTSLRAEGSVSSLASLEGIDAAVDLRGSDLADLYALLGVVLPNTPAYALKGQLSVRGEQWQVAGMQGKLGTSDLSGNLTYDMGPAVPLLSGKIQSRVLDMDDLAPLIGLTPSQQANIKQASDTADQTGTVNTAINTATNTANTAVAKPAASTTTRQAATMTTSAGSARVLPNAPLDTQRLAAMNADVVYTAHTIRHVQAVPIEQGSVHVRLQDSTLRLDPLSLGVAGGRIQGHVIIEGKGRPANVQAVLSVRNMQLDRMFPTVSRMKDSLGRLNGDIDLRGPGNSVAQWLGSSSGHVQVAMGEGRFSNLLLEVVGLDGAEIIKFFLQGDRNVELRCAAAAFNVQKGLMTSETLVLDTSDTVVLGEGRVNLADETLNITLRPAPKDRSFLSLRSPLKIGGTFSDPAAGPDKGALAGRAGLALALGAINPLLALAATIETGPGVDTDCATVLAEAKNVAAKDSSEKRGSASTPPVARKPGDTETSRQAANAGVTPVRR